MAMAAPIHASSITKISSTKQVNPFTSQYRPSSLALSHTLSLRSTLRRPMVAAAATTAVEADSRSNSTAPSKSLPFRVGHGFDLHRLEPGYPLIIGGIDIPHDRGCEAHSDGDVLLHCVVDAILGALGLPDIGQIFPDSDPKWKGAPSSVFIKEAVRLMHEAGYEIAEANFEDVDFKDVSREGVTYNAKVSVSNPYGTAIPICEISYTLKSADRVIASGKMEDPGSLPGNEKTVLEVPVKVPHSILVSLVRDISADWDIDYQLDLGLTIDLPLFGDLTIPLSRKGEIKLPTLSDVF